MLSCGETLLGLCPLSRMCDSPLWLALELLLGMVRFVLTALVETLGQAASSSSFVVTSRCCWAL